MRVIVRLCCPMMWIECNVQCSAEKFILLLPSVLSKCILKLFIKCLQLFQLYMQITVCCYTWLYMHIAPNDTDTTCCGIFFQQKHFLLFKELNMYLKLPWKLLGAWEKKRVACPGRKIYLSWMMQNSLQLAQKLCWYICPQTLSVLRSKQTLDIHKITSKHITSLEIFS